MMGKEKRKKELIANLDKVYAQIQVPPPPPPSPGQDEG